MSIAGAVGFLVLLIMLAALAGGVLLIVFSRRRGADHPACGECGYNIQASIGTVARCPECGADFKQAGITPPRGGRRRNPIMIAAGVLLIVLAVGCLGSSLVLPLIARARSAGGVAAPPAPTGAGAPQSESEDDPAAD